MRTTLDIADDVLFAAKDFARRDKKTLGQVISEWGRSALQSVEQSKLKNKKRSSTLTPTEMDQRLIKMGFRFLPNRQGLHVSNDLVNRIREEEGI